MGRENISNYSHTSQVHNTHTHIRTLSGTHWVWSLSSQPAYLKLLQVKSQGQVPVLGIVAADLQILCRLSTICKLELSHCASLPTQHVQLSGVPLRWPDSLDSGTHCHMNLEMQTASIVLNSSW